MSDNNSIWDISSKTIILAFDLVVDESLNLPQRFAAALQTPGVKNTIRKALEAEAKKLVTAHLQASYKLQCFVTDWIIRHDNKPTEKGCRKDLK